MVSLLGKQCVELDVNSMKPLDNLCHPISVIKEAEELAAEAFGAAHAFLMVGGTTSAVQTMVLTACKSGEKIILPRNVHRSVINALVVNGATPIYVNPDTDSRLGIALGMKISQVERAIEENPEAKAILVNNPTYYGICSNLKKIVELAHEHGMMVLVDEAHGTHFYFGEDMPITAMAAGADMASVSMHKSGGSLTQSSFLLTGPDVSAGYVRQVINLTQTTSASYLLISSLDISRRNLALRGKELFAEVMRIANYARTEINKIGGYYAYGKELINGDSVFDFDPTKLTVYTLDIGLAGIEVYDLLRDEYDIQLELGDMGNVLAYISIGDRMREVERLVSALVDVKRRYNTIEQGACESFQNAWNRVGMEEAGNQIVLIEKETLAELRDRLSKRRSPDILIIDSVHYWLGFKINDYMKLLADFPQKLFIFIAHERAGEPKGDMAKYIRYNSDIKIHVEHFKAFVTTRFANAERGEGIEDYTIWQEGANKYWLNKV